MKYPFYTIALTVLAACGPQQALPEKTFSIRLEPATLNLRVTETGSVKVIVSRTQGFSEAITVTLGGESTGLESTPLNITTNEGTLSFKVGDAAKIGTSFPTVQAKAGTIQKSETLTLKIAKAIAEASKITVKDNAGSSQVRQGVGDAVLEVEGKNFDRVTAFKVGDLEVSLLPGRTPTLLQLQAKVPHGAKPGAKDLVLTADGGDTTFAALVVTAITSGPNGNDSTGVGTTEKPFRSMKKALSIAQSGDTVRLLNGSYSTANGETWPSTGGIVANVPAEVTVEGESSAAILAGPGSLSNVVGLAFSSNSGVKNLTFTGFTYGLYVINGSVALEGIITNTNGVGLGAQGGNIKLNGAELKSSRFAIFASGTASLEIIGGKIHANTEDGIRIISGTPTLQATGLEIYNNPIGIQASAGASLSLIQVNIHHNTNHGLYAVGSSSLSITGSELHTNTQAGLWFGGKSLVLRGSTIRDNQNFGLYVEGTPDKVDLGNSGEAGNNDLHGNGPNGTADQILDVRLDRAALSDPNVFTLSATKLNNLSPGADIYPGDGKWPFLNAPYFSIFGKNNLIRVY